MTSESERLIHMFDQTQGDRIEGAKYIAVHGTFDVHSLSEDQWQIIYAAYVQAHEDAGIPVSDFADFKINVAANIEFVNNMAKHFK